MSILRLKNITNSPKALDWAGNFSCPSYEYVDLIDAGTCSAGDYGFGFKLDDFIGVRDGYLYNKLADMIRSKSWRLNDGDRDYYYNEALHFLKSGEVLPLDQFLKTYGSYTAFETHNLADSSAWVNGRSEYAIVPSPGRSLFLLGTKTHIADDCEIQSPLLMSMMINGTVVQTWQYDSRSSLILGMDSKVDVALAGSSGGGVPYSQLITYNYKGYLEVKFSMNMSVSLKIKDDALPGKGSLLKIRLEALSVVE